MQSRLHLHECTPTPATVQFSQACACRNRTVQDQELTAHSSMVITSASIAACMPLGSASNEATERTTPAWTSLRSCRRTPESESQQPRRSRCCNGVAHRKKRPTLLVPYLLDCGCPPTYSPRCLRTLLDRACRQGKNVVVEQTGAGLRRHRRAAIPRLFLRLW